MLTTILIIVGTIAILLFFFYPKNDSKALSPKELYQQTFTMFDDAAKVGWHDMPDKERIVEVNRLVREWAYEQIARTEYWQLSLYRHPRAKKNLTFWEYFKDVIELTNKN